MKLPVAIVALLLATGTALPLAATDPSAPVEMVQYRPMHRQDANHPQPLRQRDGYNAHASVPAALDSSTAVPERDVMPPGWHCVQRRGDDPSAFPSWEFCN